LFLRPPYFVSFVWNCDYFTISVGITLLSLLESSCSLTVLLIAVYSNRIDWEYSESQVFTVEQYETNRPARRTHVQMVLPRGVRQDMLKKEWNVSQGQIAAAVRNNIRIKTQRRSTVSNLDKATKIEEMMEYAGKNVLRGIMFKKSTSKQLQDLEKQHEEAEKRRSQSRLELQMADEYGDDIEDIEDTLESSGES
jgi:hypothetical protein